MRYILTYSSSSCNICTRITRAESSRRVCNLISAGGILEVDGSRHCTFSRGDNYENSCGRITRNAWIFYLVVVHCSNSNSNIFPEKSIVSSLISSQCVYFLSARLNLTQTQEKFWIFSFRESRPIISYDLVSDGFLEKNDDARVKGPRDQTFRRPTHRRVFAFLSSLFSPLPLFFLRVYQHRAPLACEGVRFRVGIDANDTVSFPDKDNDPTRVIQRCTRGS